MPENSKVAAGEVEVEERLAELQARCEQLQELANRRERQLLQAERLAKLGTLSAGIAHEINTPLTYIVGNCDLLQKQRKKLAGMLSKIELPMESQGEIQAILEAMGFFFDPIIEGTERISGIINSMVRFTRSVSGEPQPVCLQDCVDEALLLCRNALKYHMEVEVQIPPELPEVMARPQEMEQVLVNLLKNAADATEGDTGARMWIRAEATKSTVRLLLEDNGPGIPESQLEAIWKPFFSTKGGDEGIGLGLAVSRRLVEGMNGSIRVETRAEGGSRFILSLPAMSSTRE